MAASAMPKLPPFDGAWRQTRPGERCFIRVAAKATNGRYSVVEIESDPGDSTPLHVHANEDEQFFVLEGTMLASVGGKTFEVAAGSAAFFPRNVPHAFGNASTSPLRILAFCTPGGVEDALRVIAAGDGDVSAVSKRYGVEIVGPPLIGAEARDPSRAP